MKAVGKGEATRTEAYCLLNTSLAWSTVNRTPHTVAGKEKLPPTPAACMRDCNRRGALEYVTWL